MSKEWFSNWECDDEIICPYCGKKYEPIYDETCIGGEAVDCYKEGEQGEFTCDECGKKFILSAEMKWIYTTETINGEMTEEDPFDTDNTDIVIEGTDADVKTILTIIGRK